MEKKVQKMYRSLSQQRFYFIQF